jgi:hypothetical protein
MLRDSTIARRAAAKSTEVLSWKNQRHRPLTLAVWKEYLMLRKCYRNRDGEGVGTFVDFWYRGSKAGRLKFLQGCSDI